MPIDAQQLQKSGRQHDLDTTGSLRGLTAAGLGVMLMETRQVMGALRAMPIKTDRRDAEGIARLLHLGWFRPVHCKLVSAQEVRAVLNAREAAQQGFIALEMSVCGLLRNFGLKVGSISRGRFEHRTRELATGNPKLERQPNQCYGHNCRSDRSWPGGNAMSASLPKRIWPAAA
ncbi:hypothetical protein ACFFIZ_17635 [Paracoccus rhizosphaerae]|uniref:Transposase n=1 Tax=Paracoccus rhizosphaerae TaxID=1133347 RepID=A0ABV6CMU2_9RHOB|nr:hypothetical protein [Paracoccus rhizosphaerae]